MGPAGRPGGVFDVGAPHLALTLISMQGFKAVHVPSRLGGLGIQDPRHTRLPARLAWKVDFIRRARDVLGLPGDFPFSPADLGATLTLGRLSLGDHQPLPAWAADPNLIRQADR